MMSLLDDFLVIIKLKSRGSINIKPHLQTAGTPLPMNEFRLTCLM
jgi:hypothetical protein